LTTDGQAIQAQEERQTRLREYWRVLNKRRWYAVLFAVLTVSGALLLTVRETRIYRATATLHIDVAAPQVLGSGVEDVVEVGAGNYWSDKEYYETQYQVIKSRTVARGVVERLGLHQNADFVGVPPAKRRGWRGVDVDRAAAILQGRLTVDPVKGSRLVRLQIDDPDPRRATLIVNALADVYIRQNLAYKLASTVEAVDWLAEQLEQRRSQLEDSEMAMHGFKRDHNVLSVSLEERQNILANGIERLSQQLTDSKTRRIALTAGVSGLRRLRDADPLLVNLASTPGSTTLQNLRGNYAVAAEAQAAIASRYGENHPASREANGKLGAIRDAIAREVRTLVEASERELRGATEIERDIGSLLAQVQEEALQLNLQEIEYNRLARHQDNMKNLYEMLLKRSQETDLSRLVRVNNIRILDAAEAPQTPVRPNVPMNMGLALLVGLIGGIGLAFFVEFMDNTIKSKEDVETSLALPFLGIVPRIGQKPAGSAYGRYGRSVEPPASVNGADLSRDRFVADYPKSTVAECFRTLRTNLLFIDPDHALRTLLVTSSGPQEGKTSTSLNLAISVAQGGNRTLVVDTDMRRPRMHRILTTGSEVGVSSVIIGGAGLDDAVKETGIPNLWVLPCGPIPPNPAELLHSDRFRQLVAQLGSMFDRVVFDSPPVNIVTDASIIGTMVDGIVLVVRSNRTLRGVARHAKHQLQSIGGRILGAVLNDVDLSRRGGSYDSYYYYSYGYQGAYAAEPAREEPPAESRH